MSREPMRYTIVACGCIVATVMGGYHLLTGNAVWAFAASFGGIVVVAMLEHFTKD